MNFMDLMIASLSAFVFGSLRSLLTQYYQHLPHEFDSSTIPADYYDFIVVGAGCGGSVVASRLSETNARVLLLEAGGSAPPETAIASLSTSGILESETWEYTTKPQQNAFLGFTNYSNKFNHGKTMGGTSTTNGLIYNRGNKMDFDRWAELGNTDWGYDSILPYFKKSESYNDVQIPVDAKYHGFNGPVKVQRKKIANKLTEQFMKAGQEMGYRVIDPNGAEHIGFSPSFLTMADGVKGSASESYLTPIIHRRNLLVRTNAPVRRVLFNSERRAVGVQYVLDGQKRVVYARKEVILSAGVVRSPQILMVSGIGPRKHLEEMRIPVVAAVEGVGQNLQEHPGFAMTFAAKETSVPSLTEIVTPANLKRVINSQDGPLAEPIIGDGYAYFNLADPENPSWPDFLMGVTAASAATLPVNYVVSRLGLKEQVGKDLYDEFRNGTSFTLLLLLARPKSRGRVSLRSANPVDVPVVDVNVYDHPDDVALMVKGIRKASEVVSMPALKDTLDARGPKTLLTPCRHHGHFTDAYWECFVRQVPQSSGYHMSSSLKMAPHSDPMGVVSPRLSVRGVTGLRVVDASVMPNTVAGNPMAAIYMVAEKASDMIKQDWGYQTEPLR